MNMKALRLMRFKVFDTAEDLLDQCIVYLEGIREDDQDKPTHIQDSVRVESVAVVPPTTTFVVGSKQDSSFAMFDKAFSIVPTGHSYLLSDTDISLILCVLYYNLALCFRLSGLASRDPMIWSHELEKCLFAYEMANNYLQDLVQECQHPSRLLELALLNNTGHVYCLLWETEETLFRLGQMKVLLEEHQRMERLTNSHEDLSVFSNNVNYNESMLAGLPPPAA